MYAHASTVLVCVLVVCLLRLRLILKRDKKSINLGPLTMNPISNQALRTALDHETISIVRMLQADNEHLQNEFASANADLGNRYLRSVLNLIDKHRKLDEVGGVDVLGNELALYDDVDQSNRYDMLTGLIDMPVAEKLRVIPALCELGYFVRKFKPTLHDCPFAVDWNTTEEHLHHLYQGFFARGESCIARPILTESLPSAV